MSKKLIAVAAAAALALTGLVGIAPAVAAPAATITGADSGSGSSAVPFVITVPSANTLVHDTNAVTYTLSNILTNDVIRVTTTGSVKIVESLTGLNAAQPNVKVASLGSQVFTETTDASGNVVIFLYTTDTTTGTAVLSVTRTGLTAASTLHLKGAVAADSGYDLGDLQGVPATLALGAKATVSFTAKDVLGNLVESDSTIVGVTGTSMGAVTFNATTKRYESVMTSTSSTEFLYSLDTDQATTVGYSSAKDTVKGVVNVTAVASQVTSLTAQVATLTAQVAALTAQLANSRGKDVSVTKKKYNALAKRYNSAFPGQKVALKQ